MISTQTLELLAYLRSLDVKFSVHEGRLRYSAPEGVLTPQLRAELVQHKAEIVELLGQVNSAALAQPPIQPIPRQQPLPLSFGQQRFWFFEQLEPDNFAYNEALAFRLTGQLNIAALEESLNKIIRRHELLRTTFITIDGQPALNIQPQLDFKLAWVDFTGSTKPEAELQAFIRAEHRRPFDLAAGPLLRAYLLQLQPQEYVLLVTMHHIMTDGWSTGIFIKELTALYPYFSKHSQGPYPLPDLPIQYVDFAHWQRQWLQGPVLEKQAAYWEQQLGGRLPLLHLPTDHPRPPVQSFQGATYSAKLPEPLTPALRRLSQQQGVTPFMTLLAAFEALLFRYTGQEDILIGTPVAGRNRREVEALIGFFVNTLVLRTNLAGHPTFGELLQRVRKVAVEAYAHQDFPFEKLVDKLQPERNLSHQPLFQVMFAFENTPTTTLQIPGVVATPVKLESGAARFDLTLFIEEDQSGFSHTWGYNTALFEPETIARMAAHFQNLLEGVIKGGVEHRLSALPLLSEAEQHRLLREWNETGTNYPVDKCFHHLFEAQVERTPEAIALVFGRQQLSYQALNRRANQLAHFLQKQGAGPEVLVGLCVERSVEMVVGMLGILKAGGAYLPLDPTYPALRLAFMLEDSGAPLILTQRRLAGQLDFLNKESEGIRQKPRLLYLDGDEDDLAQAPVENPSSAITPAHLAYLIYTSGSTGQPKGTMVPHSGLVNYVSWAGQAYRVAEGEGAPVHSSLSFDLTITGLFLPLLAGRTVTLLPEDQVGEALTEVLSTGKRFSLVKITPAHLELLNRQLPAEAAAAATKSLVIGGEALLGQDLAFWRSHAPETRLINEYGPTETVVGCCVYEVPGGDPISGAVPIGRPIANTQLYLLDRFLKPVPVGVPGELYIGGAGVARGYLNRPELTAERFIPDPFSGRPGSRLYKTGDLARYRPDGNLEFLGRIDQQVKIRGFRIELEEVEAALKQHSQVQEAVVLADETNSGHKRLIAYVVAQSGAISELAAVTAELRQFLQARLPAYMIPANFIFVDAFPLTPNGKIDRQALPDMAGIKPDLTTRFTAARTEAETILAQIWADLLGLSQVSIYDNFFELGGDSILIIQVVARANQAGLRLRPRQMFQYQTIAELAAVVDTAPVVQAEQGLITGEIPLTPIQHWFFEKKLARPDHWNMAMLLKARSKLDPLRLEQLVAQLLAHHDALRLRFKQAGSGWQQFNGGLEANPQSFVRYDLATLTPTEQKAAIEAQAEALQASLNLEKGPIIQVALFELGGQQPDRLLIIVHHLAMDGVSWRILLEDLQTAYRQLGQNAPIQLPLKTTSFQQWAKLLQQVIRSPRSGWRPDPDYWLAQAQQWAPKLPVDDPAGRAANSEASAEVVSIGLSETETSILLKEAPAAYHTQINDILLTALVQAFSPWTGSMVLRLDLEGHGREEMVEGVDLSRTVGWFTTLFPVRLDLEGIDQPGDAIKAVKEQLRRVPNRGIDYGLLRFLGDETLRQKLGSLPGAEVSFNYLGQFDQLLAADAMFELAEESSGPAFDFHSERSHLIEVVGVILEGKLQLDWIYSRNIHRRQTIESLSQKFIQALQALIAHCQSPGAGGYTPSDFPEADSTQAELDNLLAALNK